MARKVVGQLVAILGACLLAACLGGQTGQPNTAACVQIVPAQQAVDGITPSQLAQAYAGAHHAALHWPGDAAAMPAEDITITISGTTSDGQQDACESALSATVQISVQTSDGTVSETGTTLLSAPFGALEPATFTLVGQRFVIEGSLSIAETGPVAIHGKLTPRFDSGTNEAADFSSE